MTERDKPESPPKSPSSENVDDGDNGPDNAEESHPDQRSPTRTKSQSDVLKTDKRRSWFPKLKAGHRKKKSAEEIRAENRLAGIAPAEIEKRDLNKAIEESLNAPGVPGPSRLSDEKEPTSPYIPRINEDEVLDTTGDKFKKGWQQSVPIFKRKKSVVKKKVAEVETTKEGSSINISEELPDDLEKAQEEIMELRKLAQNTKEQLEYYRQCNEDLRKKAAKGDDKVEKLTKRMKREYSEKAELQRINALYKVRLQLAGLNTTVDSPKTPANASPDDVPVRAGTPARGARRRPTGTSTASNSLFSSITYRGQQSPETIRADTSDTERLTTSTVLDESSPVGSPSALQKKRHSADSQDSPSRKRRRSPSLSPPAADVDDDDDQIHTLSPILVSIPLASVTVHSPSVAPVPSDGGSEPSDDDDDDDESDDSVFIANPAPAPRRRARRALGPRPGSYIPPAPPNAAEQPRVWNRGQGRTTTLRPKVPLNLNVDQWFDYHMGRIRVVQKQKPPTHGQPRFRHRNYSPRG